MIPLKDFSDLCMNNCNGSTQSNDLDNCKCFEHTLTDSSTPVASPCFEYDCGTKTYNVVIGEESYECIDGETVTFNRYQGSIECAPFNEICQVKICLFGCSARGRCVDGICECETGYSGPYCNEYTCDESCTTCIGPSRNQCLGCKSAFLVYEDDNFYYGHCDSTLGYDSSNCLSVCKRCTKGPDSCTSCHSNAVVKDGLCECSQTHNMDAFSGECISKEIQDGCHPNCLSCLDEDPNYCLSCSEGTLECIPSRCYCQPNYDS